MSWWWRGEGRRTIRWFIVLGSQDGLRLIEKRGRQELRRVDRRGDPKEEVDLTSRSSTRLGFGSESSKMSRGKESSTLACLKGLTRAPPFDPPLLAWSSPAARPVQPKGTGVDLQWEVAFWPSDSPCGWLDPRSARTLLWMRAGQLLRLERGSWRESSSRSRRGVRTSEFDLSLSPHVKDVGQPLPFTLS